MNDTLVGYFIGLMSGTSLDGIDCSLIECRRADERVTLHHHLHHAYSAGTRDALRQINAQSSLASVLYWHNTLPTLYAEAVLALLHQTNLTARDIHAIGCHGQTVWHDTQHQPPVTVQLGNPSHLAEHTGITVVADFRQRDLAAGGQAAPLAPLFHRVLFQGPHPRAVLNLGGIANISLLGSDAQQRVSGFDCGPANTLLDAWCKANLGHAYDHQGQWAASGNVDDDLLQELLNDPFFSQSPPRSTGPEQFNLAWLKPQIPAALSAADVQATLVELTAQSIAQALQQCGRTPADLIITGGGARNHELVNRITAAVAPCPVQLSDALGVPAEAVESAGFAWLASAAMAGKRYDLSAITGATEPLPLGGIYPA